MNRPSLPPPDPAAIAGSRALAARLAAEIASSGGWMSFDRFMARALYEPGLGYYTRGRPVFGADGDFVTGPELTPLYGGALSRQVDAWLAHPALRDEPAQVIEFGAGSGALAVQLLNGLARLGRERVDYRIVELSADLRERQRQHIAAQAPMWLDRVAWLDRLPDRLAGVVVGNELLDAMPARLFAYEADTLAEVGVGLAPGAAAALAAGDLRGDDPGEAPDRDADIRFVWAGRPAGADLQALVAQLGVDPRAWQTPYRSELCPQQGAWLRTVAERLACGAILLVDYGFPAGEYYHPQRAGGTLMAHFRHRANPDPLGLPGLQDITAHVDFSSLLRAGLDAGLAPLGYTSQARFLLNCGLLDELSALPREPERIWYGQAHAVQRLLSEAEMGELFKVIAFGKGLGPPVDARLPGFGDGDRLGALR